MRQTTAPSPVTVADQGTILGNLIDYRYTTFLPALALMESERNTIRLLGSAGRYEALDDISDSDSASLQLGFDRQLSEIWTLKTTAGYSRAKDRYNFFVFGKYLLERHRFHPDRDRVLRQSWFARVRSSP